MDKISSPGRYSGYNNPGYDGYKRFSVYVTVRDGTKLALDYYRPTKNGMLVEDPLPVIWHYTPYGRISETPDGRLIPRAVLMTNSNLDDPDGAYEYCDANLKLTASFGYIYAIADVRGTSSSYGWTNCGNDPVEGRDGYDLNEWMAAQPWCNGKIGMIGSSYNGNTVVSTMREQPPHLVAVMLGKTDFERFDDWCRGGISRSAGMSDLAVPPPAKPWSSCNVPVDEDTDGSMLKEAQAQHRDFARSPIDRNEPQFLNYWTEQRIPFRDSWSPDSDSFWWQDVSPLRALSRINDSKIAVYCYGGWNDIFPRATVVWYNNLKDPYRKLIMGPWNHPSCEPGGLEMNLEPFRFFDYWLKGIENGVMDEPPIYYYTSDDSNPDESGKWEFAEQWPPVDTETVPVFLRGGKSGTTASINDGTLAFTPDKERDSKDDYKVVYGIGDMEAYSGWISTEDIDEHGLVYTSEVLEEDLRVTGHPLAEIWVSTSSTDGDIFVTLTDADENGKGMRIAEGQLRISFRCTEPAPYNNLGLPWYPGTKAAYQPVKPNQLVKLRMDLNPTSYIFKKGHRIRVEITGALRGGFYFREDVPPTVTVYRDCLRPSVIFLPVKR